MSDEPEISFSDEESPEIVFEKDDESLPDIITAGEKIVVGTSGYSYRIWGPVIKDLELRKNSKSFYSSQDSKKMFKEYQECFNSVEINCTRYKKLTKKMCQEWFDNTPNNFEFTIKMPLYITHCKKLNDFQEFWESFYPVIKILKHKMSCLLFQFKDTSFKYTEKNIAKLKIVKSIIPENIRCAFEFRDSSWYSDNVSYDLFKDNWTIALIYYTHGGGIYDKTIGNLPYDQLCLPRKGKYENLNFTYIRLHGLLGYCEGTYGYEYIKKNIMPLLVSEKNYIYFNSTDTWEVLEKKDFDSGNAINHKVNVYYPLSHYSVKVSNIQLPSAICDALFTKILIMEKE